MNRELPEKDAKGLETSMPIKGVQTQPGKAASGRGSKAKWLLLLIPLLVLAGYFTYQHFFAGRETTDDAQIDGHINPISAKVSGQVMDILVKENQFVKEGTLLLQIDTRDYQVALDRAKADLAAAQSAAEAARTGVPMMSVTTSSQLNLADAGFEQTQAAKATALKDVDSARARMEVMQAQVREAQAAYTKAIQDLERMKLLIAKDEISKQQYDAAVAAADAARASRDAVQAGVLEVSRAVEAAQARVLQSEARIKEARANQQASQTAPQQMAISRSNLQMALAKVKQAEATLAQAELNMSYTQLKAPIDGYVSQKKVELGQLVQAGQPLLALVPLHKIWVTANFKENQLKDMRPDQKAFVSVDAYGGYRFEGHVDSIAAATGARFSLLPPENASGNYVKVVQRVPVKIIIDHDGGVSRPLRPGMSVIATVMTEDVRAAAKADSK
jgi:membrane fusion protein (multidrug efflux system)